jgi:hypothetical protein
MTMIAECLAAAEAFDWPRNPGVLGSSLSATGELLAGAGTSVPALESMDSVFACVADLEAERLALSDPDQLVDICKEAERLAGTDPLGAAVAAMIAAAAWEGPQKDTVRSSVAGAMDWGWHGLIAPLARVLATADSLWAGRDLVAAALDTVRIEHNRPQDWWTVEARDGFLALRENFERRYEVLRHRFAARVSRICRDGGEIGPPLAALVWTLGDPPRAHAIADGRLRPSERYLRTLLDNVTRPTAIHPMLAAVGGRLWRVPGLATDELVPVRRRMEHWIPTPEGMAVEELRGVFEFSPSNAYARALVSYFAGTLTDEERGTIAMAYELVQDRGGAASIRFEALTLLIHDVDQSEWRRLARRAAGLLEARRWHAASDAYDRSFDIPLHYLDGGGDEVLELVERHRRAALVFVLWNVRPFAPATGMADVWEREGAALERLRTLRYLVTLAELPMPLRIPMILHGYDDDISSNWSDRRRAIDALDECWTDLHRIAEDWKDVIPRYAKARLEPPGGLADFARIVEGDPIEADWEPPRTTWFVRESADAAE